MVILKFALKRSFRRPLTIFMSFVLPISLLLISGLWGDGGRGYYLIALVIMFGSFPLTGGMLTDRRERTIVRIMSTPTTTFDYLFQNLIACMVPLLLQSLVISVTGMLLHDWSFTFTFFIGVCYLAFAATSVAFSFAWNCLFKSKEVSFTILSMFLTLASFAGLLLPLEIFPDNLRTVAMIFPTYWIASSIEELISNGSTLRFGMSISVLTLFVVVFLLYGSKRGAY